MTWNLSKEVPSDGRMLWWWSIFEKWIFHAALIWLNLDKLFKQDERIVWGYCFNVYMFGLEAVCLSLTHTHTHNLFETRPSVSMTMRSSLQTSMMMKSNTAPAKDCMHAVCFAGYSKSAVDLRLHKQEIALKRPPNQRLTDPRCLISAS